MALITADEARTQVPSLTGDDTLIETLITEAGEMLARECGYPGLVPTMEDTTYTLDQDGPGGRELRLEVHPVVSITSITDDPTLNFTDSGYLVAAADYGSAPVKPESGLVRLVSTASHGAWSTTPGAIRAVYVAGYATVPPKLKRLCALQVRHLYDKRATQGKEASSQQGNSVTLQAPSLLAPEVEDGLGFFHLPRRYGC